MGKEITINNIIDKAKELQNFEIEDVKEFTYITNEYVREYARQVQDIEWYYEYSLIFILIGIILTVGVSILIYTKITEYQVKHAVITVSVMLLTLAPSIYLFATYKVKEEVAKVGREYIELSNDFSEQIKAESIVVKYGLDKIEDIKKNEKGEDILKITLLKINTEKGSFDELRYEGKVTGYIKGMVKEDVRAVDVYVVDEKYYPYVGSNIREVNFVLNTKQ